MGLSSDYPRTETPGFRLRLLELFQRTTAPSKRGAASGVLYSLGQALLFLTPDSTTLYMLGALAGASTTWDASSIADGDEEAKEITVTGAALGDLVLVSLSIDVADLVLDGQVTAADTVTAVLANNTGGAVDLASATLYAVVIPKDTVGL